MRVVFDLDGTLIDSAPDIHAAANGVLADEGRPAISLEQARSFVGSGAPVFISRMMVSEGLGEDPRDHARMLSNFLARYETAHEFTRIYPGVEVALDRLVQAGARLGLCTNKPFSPTQSVLAHLGMTEWFGAVLGGDSLAVRKPDPAPLRAVMDALGEGPVLYVGDSEVDAECAQRAGVPFALYTPGYRKTAVEDIPHDWAFDTFDALPDAVQDLAR